MPDQVTVEESLSEDPPVELRCSTAIFRNGHVLLVHRTRDGLDDWVLPGGYPRQGEGVAACARREVLEETGIRVEPNRCAFVLETIDPARERRRVELVFVVRTVSRQEPEQLEAGLDPAYVPLDRLGALELRPPLAGHLRSLHGRHSDAGAPYLGNLWRPREAPPG